MVDLPGLRPCEGRERQGGCRLCQPRLSPPQPASFQLESITHLPKGARRETGRIDSSHGRRCLDGDARSLPMPDLYEAIKDAEPVTPIVTHKFPANQQRYYEQMARFPEGFIIVG